MLELQNHIIAVDQFLAACIAQEGFNIGALFAGDFDSLGRGIGGEAYADFVALLGFNLDGIAALEIAFDTFYTDGEQAFTVFKGG